MDAVRAKDPGSKPGPKRTDLCSSTFITRIPFLPPSTKSQSIVNMSCKKMILTFDPNRNSVVLFVGEKHDNLF